MSILSTSKILICINSCERDHGSVQKLKNSNWYKDCAERSNIDFIFYYADPMIGCDFIHNTKELELKIKTEESYNNLSTKTIKMISSCLEISDFDFILKIDCRIIENLHNHTSSLFSFENFTKCFYNESMFKDYGGFTPIIGTTITGFRDWASSKSMFVLPEVFESIHCPHGLPKHYWAGGGYCLSRSNAEKVASQKELFEDCKNLMGGCEDICVGIACNYE